MATSNEQEARNMAQLAQWLECLLDMQEVAGSSPALGTNSVVRCSSLVSRKEERVNCAITCVSMLG